MIKAIQGVLTVFEKFSLWDEGIELIGSWCFYFYQRHYGVKEYPLRTQDVDFLIPIPYKGKQNIRIVDELQKLGFKRSFDSSGCVFLWNSEIKIEFIVPKKGKGDEDSVRVNTLSLTAIPLRYVDMLLIDPEYIEENGIKIRIPNPAAFCLHKIIISSRRKRKDKTEKDIEQAIYVYQATDKKIIRRVFLSYPKSWQKSILRNLTDSIEKYPLISRDIENAFLTLQSHFKSRL